MLRIPSDHVPQVIRVSDTGDEIAWFAMELLDGEGLDSRLQREGCLEAGEAIAVLAQLCAALDVAHRRGVVHCNINPGNIYLSRAGHGQTVAKVLGFGIAKWTRDPEGDESNYGTPLYMGPELFEPRGSVSPATDLWALGLLGFEMLTGRHYWEDLRRSPLGILALLREIMVGKIDRASARAEDLGIPGRIPAWFDDWFARCVSRDGSSLFATAGEALQALRGSVAAAHVAPVWSIALKDDFSEPVEAAIDLLRMITGESTLVLKRTVPGSIVLLIEGSRRAYDAARALFEQRRLPGALGAAVKDVAWRCGSSKTGADLFGALGRSGPSIPSAQGQDIEASRVFISYVERDSNLCDELLIHLSMMRRQGLVEEWYDRLVAPGSERNLEAHRALERSDVVLPLVSADFISSNERFTLEMRKALERHERGETQVLPVIVRACDWKHPPLGLLQVLPTGARPVTSWTNRDEAWLDVTRGIRSAVERLRTR